MGFSYNKLWKLMIDNNMNKSELKDAIKVAPKTISKMSKNENVNMDTLAKLCDYFQCDIGDIIEYKCKESRE